MMSISESEQLRDEIEAFADSGQPPSTEWMLRMLRHLDRQDHSEWPSPEVASYAKDLNAEIRQLIPLKLQ